MNGSVNAPASVVSTWTVRAGRVIDLKRSHVMGILNVTPDSFSDGGRHDDVDRAFDAAMRMVRAGATLIDIGGESTRPGADRVGVQEQMDRCLPVIERIRTTDDVALSIDTTRAAVAEAALQAGADVINDVAAGTEDDAMLGLAASTGAGLVLMHRLRAPDEDSYSNAYTDEERPAYADVVESVRTFLVERVDEAMRCGVDRDRIMIDPGLGFGKTVEQNLALMRRTGELVATGFPVLGAASRKSFLGAITGVEHPADRDAATIAASAVQYLGGIRVYRVHEVGGMVQALRAWDELNRE